MSYANRGKWLESVITHVNQIYEMNNKAIIRKVPTDINYNTRTGKAFFKAKGMVDFVGISNGKMIAFDAKNTKGKSIPFNNIQPHQVDYLQKIKAHGGAAFLLIYFERYQELYALDIDEYVGLEETLDRKSIPYSYFENIEPVQSRNGIAFDYLDIM
ncbi:Holliday junction resolvase RecU [Staphylococcus condimenti]|uniref:Holliday junction resolvase RecU n=1 Tax=Staphylococcus condimenti TaxID=70255 RepID=A0AB37H0X0_9STAP|nr:Holliday junction resolvase RecU [Staphylococcus condimenti]AMY05065.1 hypothetical protein A4G25_03620 [Staphylococcus condimenti]PNZ61239.1 Holliday junction resolvase RecU [Staphylococcus condimenti]QQS83136.1 Holliday junction resolvase RecU [Staphylococcus condimenti]QRP94429.1 Holliday junction resolvase RecU [Staphylococcus condimenti]VEG64646.1 recombination protein U [Staphylococcus condimenti]